MSTMSRRSFLAGAAAAGAAGVLPSTASARKRKRIRGSREDRRVIVIGSGFGGGVTALRLAQAGVPVLVLERGRRWIAGPNSNTFPTVQNLDKRALWYGGAPELFGRRVSLAPYAGLIDAEVGVGMTSLCAAGVGGGSLIYQGMTLQPSEDAFNRHLPDALDYRRMAAVHYPRVARMLKVRTAPDDLIAHPNYASSRIFAAHARREGYAVEKIPMPIDWSFAQRELTGELRPSYTDGNGALGVNNGGKQSVDVTYLKQAEATGLVEVAPLHHVREVSRAKDGRWSIEVDVTDENGTVQQQKVLSTRTLVMAAGANNTNKLLVRAAATGRIPDMPDRLGRDWGTNADRIVAWTSLADDFGAVQGGPVIYGSKDWADPALANTVIQASIPPLGVNARTTIMVGFGGSDGRGRFTYSRLLDKAVLSFPLNGDKPVHDRILARMEKIAQPLGLLEDTNLIVPSTWHGLGGANMGSVCDLEGRVRGQRGLYVLDGALIPGSTAACNPSMTIAAVVERAMDEIVRKDVGTTI